MEALHLVEVIRRDEYAIAFLYSYVMGEGISEERVFDQVWHKKVDWTHVYLIEWFEIGVLVD